MKKVLVIALVVVMALSVVGLASCAGTTYEGEYSYANPWNKDQSYGCKVKVTVLGDIITNVEVAEDTATMYNLSASWTYGPNGEASVDREGKANWLKYGKAMADSFVGLSTKEVLGMKVYVQKVYNPGEPATVEGVETIKYMPEQLAAVVKGHTVGDDVTLSAGATQSSARLVLAVQNALLQGEENKNCIAIDPVQQVTGQYSYANSWTPSQSYGCKVTVTLDMKGVIKSVKVDADTATFYNLSAGWVNKANWTDNCDAMIQSFVGLTAAQIKAITVKVDDNGQPSTGTNDAPVNPFGNLPEGLVVVQKGLGNAADGGATQSSARLILAVQDAVKGIN